ncbi:MAG: hypothetical protein Q8Q09_07585 [Deltaproteobacteria bacterium]|nr:hypothetical protein [Deltaproteobacteria bacterium]
MSQDLLPRRRAIPAAARSVTGVTLDAPVLPRSRARMVDGRLMSVPAGADARLRFCSEGLPGGEVVLMHTHTQHRLALAMDFATRGNLGGVLPARARSAARISLSSDGKRV